MLNVSLVRRRALKFLELQEEVKALYAKMDKLTEQIHSQIGSCSPLECKDCVVEIVDNFENTNVVYRPARVQRFQLKVVKDED